MNFRQLEYFVSVAETLSFTKTAEQFFISQTAVTQQIKALETQLDVTLLNRTKRKVELTPAGHIFLNEAKAILARMDSAIEHVQKAANGQTGSLQLGIISGYDNPKLPDIIRSFRAAYPNIFFSIQEANAETLYLLLEKQTLDLAINAVFSHTRLDESEYATKKLHSYPLIALLPANHPLSFKGQLSLSELRNDAFIYTSTTNSTERFGQYESTMAHFIHAGFTPNIVQTTENFSQTALLVASGVGVALLPAYALTSCRTLGNLVTIPLDSNADTFDIVLAYSKKNPNPTISKFMQFFD